MNSQVSQSQSSHAQPTNFLNQLCVGQSLDATLEKMLPWLGDQLQCDRVFLYVRSPDTQRGRVPFCWVRRPEMPKIYDPDWKYEPADLPQRDPMFAAALKAQPSLFIEDVETANPRQVNRDFEQQNFSHRALIHGHLCIERKLWGVLQPCVFDHPRQWSQRDRHLIEQVVGWLAPLTREYVDCYAPQPEHC
ncbi:GAF domain-containing protein [Leptolyngbya iicbica]|nr:GAF domain-containing protein [Leptolyngbya sp. LK]